MNDKPHRRWHTLSATEVVRATGSDAGAGLAAAEAHDRLGRWGPNALPEPRRRRSWSIFVGQFRSPLIYLLVVAAVVALALGHTSDAAVIFAVVLLNAVIGAFQESRAERSLEALRKLTRHDTRVVRGGQPLIVAASHVVPGDVLVLEAGDAVPADARLLHGTALQMSEAALTGESTPVAKSPRALPLDSPLADRTNMLYAGTHVATGRARAVVVGTGLDTQIGAIATLARAAKVPRTPLERRIAQFGRYVIFAALVVFVVITALGMLRGIAFTEIALIGVSQVVGMIPEGLPVAMTIALAVGVQRMARRKTIVRHLAAVETLGSTTVICSDKTGTLTRNEMTVTAVWLPDGRELAISGAGYDPAGQFLEHGRAIDATGVEAVRALLEAGVLCNDAELRRPVAAEPGWQPIGDPTEVALLTLAEKGGVVAGELRARWPRVAEIPFDPAAKMMATEHVSAQGSLVVIKGAPEVVLDLCGASRRHGLDVALAEATRRAVRDAAQHMAEQALRVLAIAVVDGAALDGQQGLEAFQDRATLLGLLGEIDPPRTEAKHAIERCRAAGVRPVMVTGDHKATGYAIARALGIARDADAAVDGRELEQMSDAALANRIEGISVFARVHPAQKLRIVAAYQRRHEVVAMTGDGVNDAPALVKADVGVAMGITGTQVAKESAKIVIGDDNFATIVAAVEEGRVVYRNIKKVVLLLFSTSAAEVAVLLFAMLLGHPPPFAAVQILWNNLVTEGLITVNLVMEPPEGDEMQQKPIPAGEPLLTRLLLVRMAFMVPAIVVATLGWFVTRTAAGVPAAQVRTETFTLLAVCEWFNVLNCRSESGSALTGVLGNPWLVGGVVAGNVLQVAVVFWSPLAEVFHTVPFGLQEAVALGVVGSLVLWVEELRKLAVRRRRSSPRGDRLDGSGDRHCRSGGER